MLPPPLHLVTDRRLVPDLVCAARAAVPSEPRRAVAVHLREKDLPGGELLVLARRLAELCHAAGQLLLVNDRLDVAVASGADGVHLPSAGVSPAEARRLLGEGRLVGVSCHQEGDVRRALEQGADYATFGPVFDTPSKRAYGAPVGLGALASCARLGLPLVALGGIDAGSAGAAVAAGARGVAAIRAWLATPDPRGAVSALLAALHHAGVA